MSDDAPSFVRGMFSGAIHDDLLFPYAAPLDERDPGETRVVRRLLATLDRMRDGLIDSARIDEEEAIPEALLEALAESGWLALSIPREYGGLGLSPSAYAHVFGEISSTDASLGVLIGVHCGLGSKALALFGSPAQKERYLPILARGETLAAYALTEPETGSDAQHIVTRARQNADGSWALTVNGRA
jgi:very long chain acyl-CoA dehydrogenase